jgi:hypothetical protein
MFWVVRFGLATALLALGCSGLYGCVSTYDSPSSFLDISFLIQLVLSWICVFVLAPIAASRWGPHDPRLPPGPFRLPIIGNLHHLDMHVGRALAKSQQHYRRAMSMNFGARTVVVIDSPEEYFQILNQETAVASRPPPDHFNLMEALIPGPRDVGFSPAGQDEAGNDLGIYWKKARTSFIKQFTPKVNIFEFISFFIFFSLFFSFSFNQASF